MWLGVWLIASLFAVAVLAVALVAWIVLPLLQIARAAQRFQEEVGPLAAEISRGAAEAGDRAGEPPGTRQSEPPSD